MEELPYVRFINRLARKRVLMHILFWVAVTIFFFFVFRKHYYDQGKVVLDSLGFMPGHMIFVYGLNYVVFPLFVLKGRLMPAIAVALVILFAAIMYGRVADIYILHYSGRDKIWAPEAFPRAIFATFSIGWIAVTIKLVKRWNQEKEVQQKLEKEKLIVELQLLKSQLHPHFLFNTLNTLYSLTLEQSSQAPQTVLKLSGLLRYILYECNEPYTLLSREIESIRNYIELEKARFQDRLDIAVSFTGDIAGQKIAPLLLLPFIENSIKHGVSKQPDQSWINLHLHVEAGALQLKLINSRDEESASDVAEPGSHGLGLQNVQRRLNLLYPDHTLKLIADEDSYLVSLGIPSLKVMDYETALSYS